MRFTHKGFTLIELLIAAGTVAIALGGILHFFIYCSALGEVSGNFTFAMSEAQSRLEEIRNHDFLSIVGDYGPGGSPGNTFSLAHGNGVGVIFIENSNPKLLKIKIVVSWRNKNNRVVGEDKNLNGVFEIGLGEDLNGNNKLDSPTTLVSLISKKYGT